MFIRIKNSIKKFFFPPADSPRWMLILPFATLGVLTILVLIAAAYGWEYTNSPVFCGTTCHTMPPEFAAYQASPHAQVACVECHIGREFVGNQLFRKAGDIRHIIATTFHTYEYPIMAGNMRPARDTCEKCHTPEKFSDDSLRVIQHFQPDEDNTPYSTYLVLKTGGGSKREGLGRGIHWHIENQVSYYATDELDQDIPYVRVVNDDGSVKEYTDVTSGFDPASIDPSQLKVVDCMTCHNRITHRVYTPEESIDKAMQLGTISSEIPLIREQAVKVLRGPYSTQEEGLAGIDGLIDYYRVNHSEYYSANQGKIDAAVQELKTIYNDSVFLDQKSDWNTHPNNIGHFDSAGCFRCHDGKHLDSDQQAIRLECNLCHSIPVVSSAQDFVTTLEISKGPEPESHLNANWISLHNKAFDATCSNCHTTEDAGGTTNTSFCSNSACHGNVFSYAGFDAPKLREILQAQLPTPMPVPTAAPVAGSPTYNANISSLFAAKCTLCHQGDSAPKGLDLTSYANIMKGGTEGAVIIPKDSAQSILLKIQSAQHFANFTADELDLIKQWIDAGALEK
jgi:nitrate/TMAO reductase-like tetraheme cytochrome c subunit